MKPRRPTLRLGWLGELGSLPSLPGTPMGADQSASSCLYLTELMPSLPWSVLMMRGMVLRKKSLLLQSSHLLPPPHHPSLLPPRPELNLYPLPMSDGVLHLPHPPPPPFPLRLRLRLALSRGRPRSSLLPPLPLPPDLAPDRPLHPLLSLLPASEFLGPPNLLVDAFPHLLRALLRRTRSRCTECWKGARLSRSRSRTVPSLAGRVTGLG